MKLLALAVFAALFAIATCQVYYPLDSDPDKPQVINHLSRPGTVVVELD